MKFEATPVIRLEIENMRHAIVHRMGVAGSQLGEYMNAEIQRQIDSYPWEEKVRAAVHGAITDAIEAHFKYGKGYQVLRDAIDASLADIGTSRR